jgi:hypothetical protein
MAEFVLSCDSQSEATITLPPQASRPLQLAADELQHTLAIITGAWLPIATEAEGPALTLVVRPGPAENHGWEVTTDRVTLYGSEPRAVLYAVYAFLEHIGGVRWLNEYEGGALIPRRETLTVPPGEQTHTPRLGHRAFTPYPAADRRSVAMVDWMAKHRCNRLLLATSTPDALAVYDRHLRDEVLARGLQLEIGHHSFRFLLPPETYFAHHPEYYAEIEGQRTPHGQLCTSNPAVADLVAEALGALFDRYPELDCCGLWPNDGFGWCECAACRALETQQPATPCHDHPRRTDTYLRFVNSVARRLAATHPDRHLSALAYVNYAQPPLQTVPAPMVRICFAPFQRCFKHPLAAPPWCQRPNAAYREMLHQWLAMTPAGVCLFEYLMLIDMFSVPYPLTHLLPAEVDDWSQSGVQGFVLEYKPDEWRTYGANAHLLTALAWSPAPPASAIINDYETALYGPAATAMGAFREALERCWVAAGPCVHHYELDYLQRATPRLLQPAMEHLGQAVKLAATAEAPVREAVQGAMISVQWLLRLGAWLRERARSGDDCCPDELLQWVARHRLSGALDQPRIEQTIAAMTKS